MAAKSFRPRWGEPNPLQTAEVFIRRFCILPESAYMRLAVWAVATHIPDLAEVTRFIAKAE